MKRVIKMSQAWIAALVFGIALTGCGGGSSSDTGSQTVSDSGSSSGSNNEQAVERTAALSWNAPLERQNNEKLYMADLAGYVISYGQDPENLDQSVRIDSADTMEYTVDGLDDGTWYFTVQAEDKNGLMSPPSDLANKTI